MMEFDVIKTVKKVLNFDLDLNIIEKLMYVTNTVK